MKSQKVKEIAQRVRMKTTKVRSRGTLWNKEQF